jgi:hypothetical protein
MTAVDPNLKPMPANWGCVALIVVAVVGFVALRNASSPNSPTVTAVADSPIDNMISTETPPVTADPIDTKTIARAIKHLKLAFGTEGASGAMIYSQNCYASLDTHFGWGKLDQCGTFDALVAQEALAEDWSSLPTEQHYFEIDRANSRYVAAASGQSLPEAQAADRRKDLLTKLPSEPVTFPTVSDTQAGAETTDADPLSDLGLSGPSDGNIGEGSDE